MSTCDLCFEGRHLRCNGRNGCGCNVCSPSVRPATGLTPKPKKQAPPRLKPKQDKTTKATTTTAVGGPPNQRVTHGDVAVALTVLVHLPQIIEDTRIHVGLSMNTMCNQMNVHLTAMRTFVAGNSAQGFTQQSLERVLRWIESTRQEQDNAK